LTEWLQQGYSCCGVTYLGEGEFTLDVAVGDGHLPELVHPALSTKDVVDTRGHLVPPVVVTMAGMYVSKEQLK